MKHIKPYKIFESDEPNFPTTREEVIVVCTRYRIRNYTINDDLSIDVNDDIRLSNEHLEYLPLKFNYVSGNFKCYFNELITLEGCPQKVGGDFNCHDNELKTLEGCPQSVGGDFNCHDNELKTLEGCPQSVGGDFNCSHNDIETLKGCPQTVDGDFYCFGNNLVSLEGCSEIINGTFNCHDNKLKDLEYFPEVNGDIYILFNPVYSLVRTFIDNKETDNFLIEDFVDYEIVRNGDTVMLDRLETFIRDNNLKMPDLEEIRKHYKIIE
jgi:hypothetical protein